MGRETVLEPWRDAHVAQLRQFEGDHREGGIDAA